MKAWDFIIDSTPLRGSLNMAVDDYLFQSLTDAPMTYLRFYSWKNPTVSLGYSQKRREVVNEDYCHEQGIDIVRRITGGKLVLHSKEVTYCICSSDKELFTTTISESYKRISEALIFGLKAMGMAPYLAEKSNPAYIRGNLPCFSYPAKNEIKVAGKKVIGSAQKRIGDKFLQHGSIPLKEDDGKLKGVSCLAKGSEKICMIPVSNVLGRDVYFDSVVSYLASGFSEYFGIKLKPETLTQKEKTAVAEIEKSRYLNPEWIKRR
jgi:lipoate-protein ligase A